jgi:hypothetical protein
VKVAEEGLEVLSDSTGNIDVSESGGAFSGAVNTETALSAPDPRAFLAAVAALPADAQRQVVEAVWGLLPGILRQRIASLSPAGQQFDGVPTPTPAALPPSKHMVS